ncbi:MAG: LysR family transcriptional regulator [Desulfobacterales bacterium]|nr:LysR family transcriptional regulator [Desulfobacterales bacterium]
MDLWQLTIFCKVVELKSFSRAGEAVHISQPTISGHIKELENHFECKLIDRLTREAIPTKAGELLYDYARGLLALRDEAESAMAEFNGAIKGELPIGGSTIPGAYILPRIIALFAREHPGATVNLDIGDSRKICEDILSREIELGVVGARMEDKRLRQERIVNDRMRLIAPADHPWAGKQSIPWEALRKEPFIAREPGSGTLKSMQSSLMRTDCAMESLNIVTRMGSTEAVIQGIKHRAGVSILSTIAAADELRGGALIALDVEGVDLKRGFYLTRCEGRTLSPLARAFVRFMKKVVRQPSTINT